MCRQADTKERYPEFGCPSCGWSGDATGANVCMECYHVETPADLAQPGDEYTCAECGRDDYLWSCPACGAIENDGGAEVWECLWPEERDRCLRASISSSRRDEGDVKSKLEALGYV